MKTVIKLVLPVIIAGCFSGCVSTSSASYRARGDMGDAWQIQGSWNQVSDKIEITIDDTTVISGKVGLFSTSKTLTGRYNNRPVSAILTRSTSYMGQKKMHCIVTISGELAANFDW